MDAAYVCTSQSLAEQIVSLLTQERIVAVGSAHSTGEHASQSISTVRTG
jgi:hypothetical protein